MPKVSELRTANQIAAEELADPEIRREHERTALAHEVAMRVIGYRLDHGLSQIGLARRLGMHQPAIARLEAWKQFLTAGLQHACGRFHPMWTPCCCGASTP